MLIHNDIYFFIVISIPLYIYTPYHWKIKSFSHINKEFTIFSVMCGKKNKDNDNDSLVGYSTTNVKIYT